MFLGLLFGTAAGTNAGATASNAGSTDAHSASPRLAGFTSGSVEVDGGPLFYVRGGSGPPLVLLHGWPETWWSWHKVMPALAQKHTVIAFDLPGLGQSGIPASGYEAATVARRIHQAVTRLGYTKVPLLTHDVGSLVAYPYARDFPESVSRMVVMEAPLNGFGLEDYYGLSWHFGFNATAAPVPERIIDDQAAVRTYLGWLYDGTHKPEAVAREVYFRAYSDPARRTAGYNYYRAYPANAADNRANAHKRLKMPVLAMGGQYMFGEEVAVSFKNVADDVRPVVAPDSGHFIPEENPRFVIDCARFFFGGPENGAPPPALAGCAP